MAAAAAAAENVAASAAEVEVVVAEAEAEADAVEVAVAKAVEEDAAEGGAEYGDEAEAVAEDGVESFAAEPISNSAGGRSDDDAMEFGAIESEAEENVAVEAADEASELRTFLILVFN